MNRSFLIVATVLVIVFVGIAAWRALEDDGLPQASPAEAAAMVADPSRQQKAEFWQEYRHATNLRMAGRRADAATAYRRALAIDPDHQDALYYLGNMLAGLERYDEALRSWERLVTANPRSARGHALLGDLFFCTGEAFKVDLARAEAAYLEAHEINKEETGHLLRLGELALATERWSTARLYFEDVLASNPASTDAAFFLAYLDRTAGRVSDAVRRLESAGAVKQPITPEGMTGEGDTRSEEPQFDRAGCSELHEFISGVNLASAEQLPAEAERRFMLLDTWLESRRGPPASATSGVVSTPDAR